MPRLLLSLTLCLVAALPARAQGVRATALYVELGGAAGAYAVGVERALATAGGARLAARLGASYEVQDDPVGGVVGRVLAVPAAAVVAFPLGRPARTPLAFETGVGVAFARWWGQPSRIAGASPLTGETFRLFPSAEATLRADALGGRLVARAGLAFFGVRHDDVTPVVAVGVGL